MDTLKNTAADKTAKAAANKAAAAEAKAVKAAEAKAAKAAEAEAKAAAEAEAKAEAERLAAEAEAKAEILRLQSLFPVNVKNEVLTVKSQLIERMNQDLKGLGACFTTLRKNKPLVLEALTEVRKSKPVNAVRLHEVLNAANFNLYRSYMTDKEKEKQFFTANQAFNILVRCVTAE